MHHLNRRFGLLHFKTPSRPAQVAGAHFTIRPLAVASARGHIPDPLAPLTTARGSALGASLGAYAGPACRKKPVAVRRFRFLASVLDVPRLVSPAGSAGRNEMQSNGTRTQLVKDDYPYELQMRLFGNHLVSLAEEATRFDFRGTYTPAEVADILRVAPSKIYDLLHTGELPSVRIGRQFRVGKFSLWCYLNSLDREGLVEDILDRFVVQHCCRDGECMPRGGQRS